MTASSNSPAFNLESWFQSDSSRTWNIETSGEGPQGKLPLSDEMLRNWSSGDLFGWTQNAGMGWNIQKMLGPQFLLLSTQGGIRREDGHPIALGYHTGHWEVGLMVRAAAEWIEEKGGVPFAAYVSDPCDGRTQGTVGMFDSLPYRNDAAIVFRRLIRSLPTRRGVLGVATCDKGLPAMMLALAGAKNLPSVIVPGGVTLPARDTEDLGKVQSIGARYSHGELSLDDASAAGCRACGSAGGGCQFLGTAATSQVIAEALGMTVPHAALMPSGQPIWMEMARQSARVLWDQYERKATLGDILTEDSFHNAIAVHAACGGSTNLLIHVPAIAFAAGLPRPSVEQWIDLNRRITRFVDCLPNGPMYHPTLRLFMAGGVPEVMWHLREMGIAKCEAKTITGKTWNEILDVWAVSPRRAELRERLLQQDGVDADTVIIPPKVAKSMGLTSTVCFPIGNLCPEGAVIKSTAIDSSVLDPDGVYRKSGPARVFTNEPDAIAAIKGQSDKPEHRQIQIGDVMVLLGRGPMGSGMEETYQVTSALKHLKWGKHVALITDARFSGVSTGACIGHVGPEALAGGPIGRLQDGDWIEIEIDPIKLTGRADFVGSKDQPITWEEGAKVLADRPLHPKLMPDPRLPDDTRLWAALQQVGGGTWGGCVYDVDEIIEVLKLGMAAKQKTSAT
ncbi:MAG: YjhG/YagF family D-xylonate dehydratase [Planctomycetota bacterium]|nr:YjhG/YagF family D-xylonate dehydratase [Planctomycetota bacterium]